MREPFGPYPPLAAMLGASEGTLRLSCSASRYILRYLRQSLLIMKRSLRSWNIFLAFVYSRITHHINFNILRLKETFTHVQDVTRTKARCHIYTDFVLRIIIGNNH